MKKYIILIFLLSAVIYSQPGDSLVGVWQDMDVVAAGWSNTFLFFTDGTFKFFYSQMDQRKRETGFSGNWRVEGDGLYLDVKQKQLLEGGRLVPDQTGRPGDSVLVDTYSKTSLYNPPEKVEMSISKVYTDGKTAMGKYVYIDAIKFYLMSENPAEMLHEFEGK
jgi:hypothetical protein